MMTQNLIINEELKNLLPPLSPEEFAGLEESICKDGCLSPLIVWNDIVVDGHNRYEICTKHRIPFGTQNVVLESLDDAKLWALHHQHHRRNIPDYYRAELALKLKDAIAARAKERQIRKPVDSVPPTLAEQKETRQEVAKIAGISHGNLSKVEYIAEHADEETKEKLRRGEKGTSINKEYNRLRAEAKTTETEPRNVETASEPTEQPSGQTSQFRPGSLPTKRYVGETQLKPIPRDRPDILVANLVTFFPEEFVPNTAREIFRFLYNRYGKDVTKPLAVEFYNEYGRRK